MSEKKKKKKGAAQIPETPQASVSEELSTVQGEGKKKKKKKQKAMADVSME